MGRGRFMLLVALAAGALSACGSGKPGSTPTSTGPSTSAIDQSAARAVTSSANDTTRVDSATYRKLVATAASEKGLSPPIASKVADCVVKQETAQGYRTLADLTRSATSRRQAVQDAIACTARALPRG